MNVYILSTLCFGFSSLLLGALVYLKRRDKTAGLWLAFSVAAGFWALGYSFQINNTVDATRALGASRFADGCALFIPVLWLHFLYEFLGIKANRKILVFLYASAFAVLSTITTPLFISGMKDKSHIGFDHFVAPGPTFHYFALIFFVTTVYAFGIAFKRLRELKNDKYKADQIRLLLIAAAFGFSGGAPAFLPVYDIDLPIMFGTFLMVVFPFLMVLTMTRYRFMDVEEMAWSAHRDKLVAIGMLTASINHEIKNPLYVIQGMTESHLINFREGLYSDQETALKQSNSILEKTKEQSQRAMAIIAKFSDFAKRQVSDKPDRRPVCLRQTLAQIMELIKHQIELDKISLIMELPEDMPRLMVDPCHLEEIFFNLIMNACQELKEAYPAELRGRGEVRIKAQMHKDYAEITVTDNGRGLTPQVSRNIFKPFNTAKRLGTGLGLYITKQLSEKNGGGISVSSLPAGGLRFLVVLPVDTGRAATGETARSDK